MGTRHASESKRRKQILDAARRVFLRKGYYETRMDDIASEASLSKGALYWYYDSKREVFLALYRAWFEEVFDLFPNLLSSDKNTCDKIYDLGIFTVQFLASEPEGFRGMLELYIQALDDEISWMLLGDFYRKLISLISDTLSEGIKKGELRPDLDILSTSLLITYNIDMLGLIPIMGFKDIDLKKHWEEAYRIILKGIAKNPSPGT